MHATNHTFKGRPNYVLYYVLFTLLFNTFNNKKKVLIPISNKMKSLLILIFFIRQCRLIRM